MPRLVFYRQAREDGGVRTGIDVDGWSIDHFQEGGGEPDPALRWFIDLRAEAGDVPADPEEGVRWLTGHRQVVRDAYLALADALARGKRADTWPLVCEAPNAPHGPQVSAACSAVRAVLPEDLAAHVRDLADRWEDYVEQVSQARSSAS